MKQFFYVVFGGLTAIFLGISISYGGAYVWKKVRLELSSIKLPSTAMMASAIIAKPTDGTEVSGLKRVVSFSAEEEEDAISAATRLLPFAASDLTAVAYLVKNLNNTVSVITHNSEKLLPIASLTKLVTAVVARQHIPAETKIALTKEMMATYGNTAQFKIGEKFTSADLMYPLLMVSSNDAAEAFAQSYGREKFLKAMNEFTQSIGAYRTHFDDPSGLSPTNVSTANDLALILDWIRKNDPEIIAITQLKSKTIRGHTWLNPTQFLAWSNYAGGKNGYTPEANRTAASLFNLGKNKDTYAIILLGSESRNSDELKLIKKAEQATLVGKK